jgi:hypothetical protein
MSEIRLDASPRTLARAEGVVYLLIIILGIFVELFVRGRIIAGGDAAATAANLTAMQSLWRIGIVAELLMVICTACSALLLYLLLKPVSWRCWRRYLVEAMFPLLNAAAVHLDPLHEARRPRFWADQDRFEGWMMLTFFGLRAGAPLGGREPPRDQPRPPPRQRDRGDPSQRPQGSAPGQPQLPARLPADVSPASRPRKTAVRRKRADTLPHGRQGGG